MPHPHTHGPFIVVLASAPGASEPLVVCTACGAVSFWNGGTWWGGQDRLASNAYPEGTAWTPVTDRIDDPDQAFDWAHLEARTAPQIAA